MNATGWSPIALAAGVLLMLAAPLAVALVPVQATWTDDDQRALQQASAEYHAALHDHSHGAHEHSPASSSQLHAADAHAGNARVEYERHKSRLDTAQSRGIWILWSLRLTGVAVAALGVWGYLRSRR